MSERKAYRRTDKLTDINYHRATRSRLKKRKKSTKKNKKKKTLLSHLFSSLPPTASTKARAKKKCDNNTKNESADVYYVDPGIALFSVFATRITYEE